MRCTWPENGALLATRTQRHAVSLLITLVISFAVPFTTKAEDITVKPAPRQARPLYELKVDFSDLAEVGLDVAGKTLPIARMGAVAVKLEKDALAVIEDAIGGKTGLLESHLLLISDDAQKLKDLQKAGRNLRTDDEAQDIVARLKERMASPEDSPYVFARKALFSRHGLYATASVASRRLIAEGFSSRVTKALGVGPFTAEAIASSKWGRLKRISRLTRNLNDALTKAFIKKVAMAIFDVTIREKVQEIQKRVGEESPGGGKRIYGHRLRIEMIRQPQLVLPVLAAPAPIPVPAPLPAPVLVMPQRIETYHDPVVNGIAVERQVIEEQRYPVDSPRETYREAPVSHPLRDEPVRSQIEGKRERSSEGGSKIRDIDLSHHFRGGFDSKGGSLWK